MTGNDAGSSMALQCTHVTFLKGVDRGLVYQKTLSTSSMSSTLLMLLVQRTVKLGPVSVGACKVQSIPVQLKDVRMLSMPRMLCLDARLPP